MVDTLTSKAEALLAAASPGPWTSIASWVKGRNAHSIGYFEYLGGRQRRGGMPSVRTRHRRNSNARLAARAPEVLRGYIAAVKTLSMAPCTCRPAAGGSGPMRKRYAPITCERCKALALWAALRWGGEGEEGDGD